MYNINSLYLSCKASLSSPNLLVMNLASVIMFFTLVNALERTYLNVNLIKSKLYFIFKKYLFIDFLFTFQSLSENSFIRASVI